MNTKALLSPLTSNLNLKALSLLCGYGLWFVLGQTVGSTITVPVPLTFFNCNSVALVGPDTITVTLQGKRADLLALDKSALAVYLDAEHLRAGKNIISLTGDHLFLPDHIKLVYYNPSNIVVTKNT